MREILFDVLLQVRTAWRYRWYAMIIAWLIAIAGWSAITLMPNTFESSARVYVDTDSILRPLLRGLTVQTDIKQRLRLMTRTLLSRPNLEKVARDTDLDLHVKTDAQKEKLLADLANNVRMNSTDRQNLYTISYESYDPKIAKDVVQSVLNIFVESTLGDTRKDSDTAQRFLDQQIAEYESRLVDAENKLAEFKRTNIGTLPGQGGNVFQRMESAKGQYDSTVLLMREAENRRNELKRQLDAAEADSQKRNAMPGSNPSASPTDARILALQTQLDTLLLNFTENHPSVQEIREKIKILEKQREAEGPVASSTPVAGVGAGMSLIDQLRLQLGTAEADLAAIRVRVYEFKKKLDELKQLVDVLPQVEAELTRLTRDYNINKQNYDALVSRRESAKISESAEAVGDNVKFRVIDPPRVPILPVGPKRIMLSIGVLFFALLVGMGVAFVISQFHPVVYDSRSLRKLTGLPVFGVVSRIWTPVLQFRRKLEIGAYAVVGVALVLLFLVVLALNQYGDSIDMIKQLRMS